MHFMSVGIHRIPHLMGAAAEAAGGAPRPFHRLRPLLAGAGLALLPLLIACNGDNDITPPGDPVGSVAGQVQDQEGSGVQGAVVTLTRADESTQTATSGTDGSFSFTNLVTGSWNLDLEAPAGFDLDDANPPPSSVTVTADETTEVNLAVREIDVTTASIEGQVVNGSRGVANAALTLRSEAGEVEASSDAEGFFSFDDLEPGEYELDVAPPEGYVLSGQQEETLTFDMAAGATGEAEFRLALDGRDEPIEIRLTASNTFDPDEVVVTPGSTIKWVNDSSMDHTITPDDHEAWSRRAMSEQGEEFEVLFEEEGEFPYFCEPHQAVGMVGVIIVE